MKYYLKHLQIWGTLRWTLQSFASFYHVFDFRTANIRIGGSSCQYTK